MQKLSGAALKSGPELCLQDILQDILQDMEGGGCWPCEQNLPQWRQPEPARPAAAPIPYGSAILALNTKRSLH
jgi:hypothetical protein